MNEEVAIVGDKVTAIAKNGSLVSGELYSVDGHLSLVIAPLGDRGLYMYECDSDSVKKQKQ